MYEGYFKKWTNFPLQKPHMEIYWLIYYSWAIKFVLQWAGEANKQSLILQFYCMSHDGWFSSPTHNHPIPCIRQMSTKKLHQLLKFLQGSVVEKHYNW